MPYCPECGSPVDEITLAARAPVDPTEVTLARIHEDAETERARIAASVARREIDQAPELAEIEASAAAKTAAAEVAVAGALMEGAESAQEPAPSPEGADEGDMVVVNDVDADSPPPAEAVEGSEPPEPKKSRGLGMWGS